jgi:toxin secretion/phage lysis holin
MLLQIESIPNYFLGLGSNVMFLGLMGLMAIDVVSGYSKALISKKYNSTIDSRGWLKRSNTLLVLVVGYPLLQVANLEWVWTSFLTLSVIANAGSVVENLTALGVPIPEAITKYLDNNKTQLNG